MPITTAAIESSATYQQQSTSIYEGELETFAKRPRNEQSGFDPDSWSTYITTRTDTHHILTNAIRVRCCHYKSNPPSSSGTK